jgi:hypothetical protein
MLNVLFVVADVTKIMFFSNHRNVLFVLVGVIKIMLFYCDQKNNTNQCCSIMIRKNNILITPTTTNKTFNIIIFEPIMFTLALKRRPLPQWSGKQHYIIALNYNKGNILMSCTLFLFVGINIGK